MQEIYILSNQSLTKWSRKPFEGVSTASISPEPADAFLIAVPTPLFPVNGERKFLSQTWAVESATKAAVMVLKKGDLVALESTSPVGTTEKIDGWLAECRPDLLFLKLWSEPDIRIAYCPERVLPGYVVKELVNNDRVIVAD